MMGIINHQDATRKQFAKEKQKWKTGKEGM